MRSRLPFCLCLALASFSCGTTKLSSSQVEVYQDVNDVAFIDEGDAPVVGNIDTEEVSRALGTAPTAPPTSPPAPCGTPCPPPPPCPDCAPAQSALAAEKVITSGLSSNITKLSIELTASKAEGDAEKAKVTTCRTELAAEKTKTTALQAKLTASQSKHSTNANHAQELTANMTQLEKLLTKTKEELAAEKAKAIALPSNVLVSFLPCCSFLVILCR